MDKEFVGLVAGLISLSAFAPYVASILQKETVPNKVTWFSFLATDILLLMSYFDSGAGATLWMAIFLTLGAATISALSLKYGVGGATKFDIACIALVAAAVGTIVYRYEPDVVLALGALAMTIGILPTYKKIVSAPDSEDALSWYVFGIGSAVNVIAIDDWTRWQIVLHPAVIAAINVPVVALLIFSRMRKSGMRA